MEGGEPGRSRIKNRLQDRGQRCQEFFTNAPGYRFLILDSALRIIDGNDVALELFSSFLGTRKEEIIGQTFSELFPDFKASDRHEKYLRVLKTGIPHYSEEVVPPGKAGKVLISVSVFKVGDGLGIIATDITKRKKALDILKANEKQFRTLAETSLAGIFILQDMRFSYVNPAVSRIFGYQASEMIGKLGPFDLTHPEDHAASEQYMGKCLDGKVDLLPFSFRGLHKNGNVINCEVLGTGIDFRGTPAILGTILDVTDRKSMREELLKVEKLQSVGVLAGGIAHDFNNLIMSIWGNIGLAKTDVPPGGMAFNRLSHAERECRRAKGLASRLITFSKGGVPVKKSTTMIKLVRDTIDLVLRESKVKCVLALSEDLWALEADEGLIYQVLYNVLQNAIEAMPEGGSVEIRAENRKIEATDRLPLNPGNYVALSIKDHGFGIQEETLAKIFDPYFSTKHIGRGLGLAVVHSIVRKHEGYIAAESTPGIGTTVQIYLPACQLEPKEKDLTSKALFHQPGKILVMDDEKIVREVAGQVLSHLGYHFALAEDGDEAVEMHRQALESGEPFDAVILDLTMPGGKGGKEIVKQLLEIDPKTKAIVSSGYSNDPVLADYKNYGFTASIPKPYEIEMLSETLKRILA